MPLAAALPHLTESRSIGVIGRLHGQFQKGLQRLGNIQHSPAQIHRPMHSALRIHRAGSTYSHPQDIRQSQISRSRLIPDAGRNVRQDMRAPGLLDSGDLPLFQRFSLQVKQAQLYRGATDIHSNRVPFLSHISSPFYIYVFLCVLCIAYCSSSSLLRAREFCTRV